MNDYAFHEPRRRPTRRTWLGSIIAAALLLSIAASLILSSATAAEGPAAPRIFYLKDSQMYYRDFSQAAPVQVSQQLFKNGNPNSYPSWHIDFDALTEQERAAAPQWHETYLEFQRWYFSDRYLVSADGRSALYLDACVSDPSSSGNLYFRDLSDSNAAPVLIAEGVYSFAADPSLTVITYEVFHHRLTDGLHQYDRRTGEAKFIWPGSINYHVSADGMQIVFDTAIVFDAAEDVLYTYHENTGTVRITDNVKSMAAGGYMINDDFTMLSFETSLGGTHYYAMDGTKVDAEQAAGFPERVFFLEYSTDEHTYRFRHAAELYCGDTFLLQWPDDIDTCSKFAACLHYGTLYLLQGTTMIPIAENVWDFELYEDGSILYMADVENEIGDLYYWCDGQAGLLLEDITYFLHDSEDLRNMFW